MVKIVTTHDFFGSFAPLRTSYGKVGGGEDLRSLVETLRMEGPTIWVDTGDLTQGGPLSLPTAGYGGVRAASELGGDVSVVGNHELDFGVPSFLDSLARLPFPVLGANAGIGLPATTMIEAGKATVGIIGLTHQNLASMDAWSITPDREMPAQGTRENAIDVAMLARGLRRQGADIVVSALHDGIDWYFDTDREWHVSTERLTGICSQWASSVDGIVCGHTLGRYIGKIGDTPLIQPWPMGAEIGILDFDKSRAARSYTLSVSPAAPTSGRWTGHGADIIDAAGENVLGTLTTPLRSASNGSSSLAYFLAQAIATASDADAAIAYSTYAQPVVDGCFAFLDAGPVTELDILQLVPYSDFTIVEADIDEREWQRIAELFGPRPQSRSTLWSMVMRSKDSRVRSLATTGGASAAVITKLLGRELSWRRQNSTLLDGLRSLLRVPLDGARIDQRQWAEQR